MKYVWSLLLIIIFLTGCDKGNDSKNKITLTYQETYYEIATPYKKGINPHYTNSTITYDTDHLEKELMLESMEYFKPNNSLLQEGQYISMEDAKLWLDQDHLNDTEKVTIDGITFQPNYIAGIHEQDFLALNGNIKGISLALILNSKHTYEKDGAYHTYIVENKNLLKYAQEKASFITDQLRNKKGLEDVKILIGLYIVDGTSAIPKTFETIGIATSKNIKWETVNHHYYDLSGSTVEKKDTNTYLSLKAVEKTLKEDFSSCTIQGIGYYEKDALEKADFKVYCPILKESEVLYLTQLLSNQMINNFENNMVSLEIQSGYIPVATISKKAGLYKSDITIWKG